MSIGSEEHVDKVALKAELKQWEKSFVAHNQRAVTRRDIKADATIAAKYSLYERLSGRTLASVRPSALPDTTPKKAARPHEPKDSPGNRHRKSTSSTPKKTPSKYSRPAQPQALSPVPEVEPTPACIRQALGPTPQKDGHVLGIFDIVQEGTPSNVAAAIASDARAIVRDTPSKPSPRSVDADLSRTPQSLGKRYFLDAFAGTPLKRKREDEIGTTSSSKRRFATPAFLRRSAPLAAIDEESNDAAAGSGPAPFRKRGLARSLSSLLQGLRQQEDKRMDDDWDILNELEQEEQAGGKKETRVPVQDSQGVEMPLGPDQAPESSEEDSEPSDQTRKPWKKKGLKRQTRRVNMRPVLHKPKKAEDLERVAGSEDERGADTQLHDTPDAEDGNSSQDDDDDSKKPKKPGSKSAATNKTTAKASDDKRSKAKPRKVNPEAHANYRSLKLKNKNSKAKGRGGRFGRR